MRVAILGAGLAGLTCAITLEKHGISPTIFEKRSQCGDRFINGEALLPLQERPIQDSIAYLADQHGIFLQPTSNIKQIKFFSPSRQAVVRGNLGFTNIRGRDSDSFESQLARQVQSKIIFNSQHTYEQILQDYTHVILATGDAAYTQKIQDFQLDLTVTLKGATIEGQFDRYGVVVWLDYDIAPQGYGFLIPFSEKEASITIAYPDYPENRVQNIEDLWDRFVQRVNRDLQQSFRITDRFEVTRYIIGTCAYPRIGNTYFVGNCFGSIMPAFGFGQFSSIMTGIYAAQALCKKGDYFELTKPLRQSYINSLALRKGMEKLNNHRLDLLVALLSTNLGNRVLNSRHNPLKLLGYALRPLI